MGLLIRHGATTIWERWDGWTPERGFQSPNMNSFNHYAYGSIGEFLFARVAGIDWDEEAPGFRSIRFRPLFDARVGWCRASYRGPTGLIKSTWAIDGREVRWTITVPANCTGRIDLPPAASAIAVDGQAPPPGTSFAVDSGSTEITVRLD
jgi:alpha-L-rhamnosidase